MKILYKSDVDDENEILAKVDAMHAPPDMKIVLFACAYADPDGNTPMPRSSIQVDCAPAMLPRHLFMVRTYARLFPCGSVILYHDGIDLHAEMDGKRFFGNAIVRFLPAERYAKARKYFRYGDPRAWRKAMRRTVAAHEAMPELMDLAGPGRLIR